MKFETILGLVIGIIITFIVTTLIYDTLKENDKSEKYLNRKFELTFLDLIVLGFYNCLMFSGGGLFVYLGILFAQQSYNLSLIISCIGCLITINFFLFFNHLLYELAQKITIDKNTSLISCKRYGIESSFYLNDTSTRLIIYNPPYQEKYGGRGIQCFGANLGICKISNGTTTYTITKLNRIKIEELISYIKPNNIEKVNRQVNFIF